MAYSANRKDQYDPSQSYSDYKKAEDARSTQNNANNVRNAADVAMASKNPYAMAVGGAVKAADKLTGGKSTEAIGKGMTKANKIVPGGRRLQDTSNRLNESGASDAIGKAASMKNGVSGGGAAAGGAVPGGGASTVGGASATGGGANAVPQNGVNQGGGQNGSLPSSGGVKVSAESNASNGPKILDDSPKKSGNDNDEDSGDDSSSSSKGAGKFIIKRIIIAIILSVLPFLLILLLMIIIITSVLGIFNDYQDAFGMGQIMGQEIGDAPFAPISQEQKDFLNRVNNVVLDYQERGITVDGMKIASIFHTLQANDVDVRYDDITTPIIQEWAEAIRGGDAALRSRLISVIFPKYKPNMETAYYEQMADEVFDYLDRYNDLIGNKQATVSTGEFSQWKQGDSSWGNVPMGKSGRTLSQIGCLVTSVSMLIAKSGVSTAVSPFNPGTFVEYLNANGGIDGGGNFSWGAATKFAPSFVYVGTVSVAGMSKDEKLNKIREIVNQNGVYAVAEVKGNTGQHWVAIDGISGSTINMMDPSSDSTDMWSQYNWNNTSTIVYYRVS